MRKLERMGDLIYSNGAEKFGTKQRRKMETSSALPKSRRQQEIENRVKERRDLRKQWRKSSLEERVGIDLLQVDLTERISMLQRAENLRIRCRRKESARMFIYKDPFRLMKGLFTKVYSRLQKGSWRTT